jgi:hypothetical protein
VVSASVNCPLFRALGPMAWHVKCNITKKNTDREVFIYSALNTDPRPRDYIFV